MANFVEPVQMNSARGVSPVKRQSKSSGCGSGRPLTETTADYRDEWMLWLIQAHDPERTTT
jgi:hypothetical protein